MPEYAGRESRQWFSGGISKMSGEVKSITMPSGHSIPQLGLGTWLSKPGEVAAAVKDALDIGYRHIDCAMAYGNQAEIGQVFTEAFQSGKVKRENLFVTSKIWNVTHSHGEATKAIDSILKDLQLSYLDLCLIHWPQGYKENAGMFPKDENGMILNSDVDWVETWRALEDAKKAGKVRSIGVSNFNPDQMNRLLKEGSVKPDNLQIEVHPFYAQPNAVKWCAEHGIVLTVYSPLANPGHMFRKEGQPDLLTDPVMVEIGKAHGKTPAQVAIRWALQRGTVCIPKSTKRSRLEENFNVLDFALTEAEMEKVNGLDRGLQLLDLARDANHPHFPFHVHF